MVKPQKLDAAEKERRELNRQLAQIAAKYHFDPEGFADAAFRWGQGDLRGKTLRTWQREFLRDFGEELRKRNFNGVDPVEPILMSVASGHGIGKSALSAIIIIFIMVTRPNAKGTVSANTMPQLQTKTWAELGKWLKRCIFEDWVDWRGSKGGLSMTHIEAPEAWRVDGQTCKEENSESFAGQHAADSSPFYLFDESSAIPDKIFEVAQGGLTDGEPIMILFGNPTKNTGYFRYTHGKFKHRWNTRQIDSRDVEGTNKELLQRWIDDYGEDSDYVRVRVKGQFPRASSMQFISSDDVAKAMRRDEFYDLDDPLIVGIDVSRGGDDSFVIYPRRGMDAKSIPYIKIPGEFTRDSMRLVALCTKYLSEWNADAIMVDSTGVGGPLADRLRQLGYPAYDVTFGGTAPGKRHANMSAYMWDNMNESIKSGLALPDDYELEEQLTQREFWHNAKDQVVMERKEDMKDRGLMSPDIADALALTYAMAVAKQKNAAAGVIGDSTSGPRRYGSPRNHVNVETDGMG